MSPQYILLKNKFLKEVLEWSLSKACRVMSPQVGYTTTRAGRTVAFPPVAKIPPKVKGNQVVHVDASGRAAR